MVASRNCYSRLITWNIIAPTFSIDSYRDYSFQKWFLGEVDQRVVHLCFLVKIAATRVWVFTID